MEAALKPWRLVPMVGLLLLCSCAMRPRSLPSDVPMNKEAGRGGLLVMMVRVNDSKPLPFIVDTGAPVTCLDQSLEPKLGTRLAQAKIFNFGTSHPGDCYATPKLYLDKTPLLTRPRFFLDNTPLLNCRSVVMATDFKSWAKDPHCPVMGILGMDVMKHYCLQLDFQSGQVRFLDPEHADKKDWGQPFRLAYTGDGCVSIDENLTGAKGRSIIDTGTMGMDI